MRELPGEHAGNAAPIVAPHVDGDMATVVVGLRAQVQHASDREARLQRSRVEIEARDRGAEAPQHQRALHEDVSRRGTDVEAAHATRPWQEIGQTIEHRLKGSRRCRRCAIVEPMTDTEPILVEQDARVVTVTFNRPEARNAMTFEMYETLHDLCDKIDKDAGVRVMVLTGAGDKAFVSGTDIRQFLSFKTKDDALGYEARITRVLSRIANMTKPTIAMIGGDAVGGGMFMSLACDLRIVAEHARFGAPVARTLGNFAAPFSLGLLAATVGPVRAREIVLTARLVSAADAKAIGLVDEVHAAAALRGRVRELAAHIAELAPLTLAATKEAVRRMIAATSPGSLEDLLLSCYMSEDFKEGARAFLEKRKANWQGR
jgi:enoyl-CoA hydratase